MCPCLSSSFFRNDHYGYLFLLHFSETENLSAISGGSFTGAQSQPYSSAGDSGISFANTQTSYPTGTSVRIALLKTAINNRTLNHLTESCVCVLCDIFSETTTLLESLNFKVTEWASNAQKNVAYLDAKVVVFSSFIR